MTNKSPFVILIALAVTGLRLGAAPVNLEQGFRDVPNTDKPWAYWWWLNGNVTEQSITSDLEAMKQSGFGGSL